MLERGRRHDAAVLGQLVQPFECKDRVAEVRNNGSPKSKIELSVAERRSGSFHRD
jgi:hypothetical protein